MSASLELRAEFVTRRQCREVLAHLAQSPVENLVLIDLVREISDSGRDTGAQVVAAWEGDRVSGVASLRPIISTDAAMGEDALAACLPVLVCVEVGLIKSSPHQTALIWECLRSRGRRALIDRDETAHVRFLDSDDTSWPRPPSEAVLRRARMNDLEYLVDAARASLLEESRPDPFRGDIAGFRRWVASRVERARLVEVGGEPLFVAYADVRQSDGWLIQGVYTWPRARRQGYARAGMGHLLREAQEDGATHVQLAVVNGNSPAVALYSSLGFVPRFDLRTILFA